MALLWVYFLVSPLVPNERKGKLDYAREMAA
jgi:hypothetical protein